MGGLGGGNDCYDGNEMDGAGGGLGCAVSAVWCGAGSLRRAWASGRAGLVLGSMMATMAMMAMGGRQQCSSEQAAGAGGCVV